MKKHILAIALSMLAISGFADDTVKTAQTGFVTISSNGSDVRTIFHNLFTQAKKNYVLQPFDYHAIHLNLENVEFSQALDIVCKVGQLRYKEQGGIYFISKDPNPNSGQGLFATPKSQAAATTNPATAATTSRAATQSTSGSKLNHSVLERKLTTKMQKADIRDVFADFAKQTEIPIEVGEEVPEYKIDAFLIDTTLRYSLDVVTKAAGLRYKFTNHQSIQVYRTETTAKKTAGKTP